MHKLTNFSLIQYTLPYNTQHSTAAPSAAALHQGSSKLVSSLLSF